jgi:hypothetical protein
MTHPFFKKSKKMSKEKVLFTIDGFEVASGRVYKIYNKPDANAPTGFVAEGTTKIPSQGIGDVFPFRFVDGVWDTGFHKDSACYRNMPEAEVKQLVSQRRKNVLEPLQQAVGDNTLYEHTNHPTLDSAMFHVDVEQSFSADDLKHRMTLYVALLNKKITPKDKQHSPQYRHSAYIVEDSTKAGKINHESEIAHIKAIRLFDKMYTADPESLKVVLEWCGIQGFVEGNDADVVTAIFNSKIKGDSAQAARFVTAIEDVQAQRSGYQKYFIFSKMNKLKGRSQNFMAATNGRWYYSGVEVGADLKSAAEAVALKSELAGIRDEILSEKTTK